MEWSPEEEWNGESERAIGGEKGSTEAGEINGMKGEGLK